MRFAQLLICLAATIGLGLAWPGIVGAAEGFRKLRDAEIKARLAAWRLLTACIGRSSTCVTAPIGPSIGQAYEGQMVRARWRTVPDAAKAEPDCREVRMSGSKV